MKVPRSQLPLMAVRLPRELIERTKKKAWATDGSLDKYIERLIKADARRLKLPFRRNTETL